ncbi:hypothetical protein FJQ55_07365 [Rhizobium glycinendophyticum]|uniref:Uncharacterized protein n=1 Tax=Rhizobium glycinendophyticum TaxID=2589807 RepID=A0A504UIS1_9HYPH|nr:hypothetical protein FJQ55_07365 [Rhizobium glycinendophyticum]
MRAQRGAWPLKRGRNNFTTIRVSDLRKRPRRSFTHRIKEAPMGRGILMWLVGVPIPIIILIMLFWR